MGQRKRRLASEAQPLTTIGEAADFRWYELPVSPERQSPSGHGPLGTPRGRQVDDPASWYGQHPELRTRPELVAFMQKDRPFRGSVLKKLHHLRCIPDIRDDQVALYVLSLCYRRCREDAIEHWQDRMSEAGFWAELAQAMGVLRNVYLNMVAEIDPRKEKAFKWHPHDVRPEPVERW